MRGLNSSGRARPNGGIALDVCHADASSPFEILRLVRSPMLAMVLFQSVVVAASTPPLTGWHEARVPGFVIVSDAGERCDQESRSSTLRMAQHVRGGCGRRPIRAPSP